MSSMENLHNNGTGSSSEKTSALERQVENPRLENERLASENNSPKTSASGRQLKDRRSENESLVSENESLSSATIPMTAVSYLLSKLDLTFDDRRPIVCEVQMLIFIMGSVQRASKLACFVADHDHRSSSPAYCVNGIALGYKSPVASYGENRRNCDAHMDFDDNCLCVKKLENGWIIIGDHPQPEW